MYSRMTIGDAAWEDPARFARFYRDPANRDYMAEYASAAWDYVGGCTRYLGRAAWRDLFQRAGYREDDRPAERPTEPMLLWRGAPSEHRARWSWTPNRDLAIGFVVNAPFHEEMGDLWCAMVEPWRLLAKITNGDDYVEYVVDTEGLRIVSDSERIRTDLVEVL